MIDLHRQQDQQPRTEAMRREGFTVLIVSEDDARLMSARFALRCVFRDVGCFFRALGRHARRYCGVFGRAHRHAVCWWTRDDSREN